VAVSALAVCGDVEPAQAQEILLTGPLAGAGAVRNQRLYRKGRFEFAPSVGFTLLDEYKRQILPGARLNYNITDWLALGVWGGISPAALKLDTALTEEIQAVNEERQADTASQSGRPDQEHRLTNTNVGPNFSDQLGTINWIAAPQIQLIPFRGKIAIFQSIYVDTDFYIFGGPAFVSLEERANCAQGECGPYQPNGAPPGSEVFPMESRTTIAPTFGLGFQFYLSKWAALGTEWRGVPFSRNVGGFDNHGTGPNNEFPDLQVNEEDREFRFNQMIVVSLGISLPFDYQVSE
jgi:outer membrane beta-barrel protein